MIPRPAYITSGPHLSGYQVTLGYATLAEASEAHAALAAPDATRTDTQPGTDGPQSGPEVKPKPIDTQPGETT